MENSGCDDMWNAFDKDQKNLKVHELKIFTESPGPSFLNTVAVAHESLKRHVNVGKLLKVEKGLVGLPMYCRLPIFLVNKILSYRKKAL